MQAAQSAAKVPSQRPAVGRRTYVIDRGFQLKYTLLLMVLGGVTSGLFGTMMYLAHVDAQRDLPLSADLRAQLASADTTLLMLVVAISVLMAVALGLLGVLITHRVAGPVYVMSHYITTLARGRFPVMRPLRKNDELQVFFGRFQEALETLRQKELEEAATIDRALAALRSPGDTQPALRELEAISQRKREAAERVDAGR
ncbi:MAG: signal protein [Myxococcota bacterium]|nr:signal protein [Myxococcota bacterium]